MKRTSALASALRSSGARVAAVEGDDAPGPASQAVEARPGTSAQPSRRGTAPITVHHPPEVRQQLKMLAAEKGRQMDDLVAEALNLLFVKYRKPEIAPRKASK